ncbi:hypothetical protein SAMN05660330_01903 [Desulforhopalus singaporensis]|uniref:Uncharacterized protein n=1 Tax=Desulforhopalus singaporensis TaxID=91360 RepID=A0A1H0QAR8_9BACT|nr:hypothetical protein SAMN05660330_01903 [Desulforhopalus singaporensis]
MVRCNRDRVRYEVEVPLDYTIGLLVSAVTVVSWSLSPYVPGLAKLVQVKIHRAEGGRTTGNRLGAIKIKFPVVLRLYTLYPVRGIMRLPRIPGYLCCSGVT